MADEAGDTAHDDQREAAERDVRERIDWQAEQVGGWSGGFDEGASPKWAQALVKKFSDARMSGELRRCPHLTQAPTQPSLWMAPLPDLLSCQGRECERRLVPTLEQRLGHTLEEEPAKCDVCGGPGPVKGVSVGVETTMIRAQVCRTCFGDAIPVD
jgi:hypothetical protein